MSLLIYMSKTAISYILFPFAFPLMKGYYHMSYNERMIQDVSANFKVASDLIQTRMGKTNVCETLREYSQAAKQLSKMCDYAELFGKVNRELIEGDKNKTRRGKKTSRYKITPEFVRATEALERIVQLLKDIKVVSLSEVAHERGKDLERESQPYFADQGRLLSLFQHFNDLETVERNHKDMREYKIEAASARKERSDSGAHPP
jgi:hypothetical protein